MKYKESDLAYERIYHSVLRVDVWGNIVRQKCLQFKVKQTCDRKYSKFHSNWRQLGRELIMPNVTACERAIVCLWLMLPVAFLSLKICFRSESQCSSRLAVRAFFCTKMIDPWVSQIFEMVFFFHMHILYLSLFLER